MPADGRINFGLNKSADEPLKNSSAYTTEDFDAPVASPVREDPSASINHDSSSSQTQSIAHTPIINHLTSKGTKDTKVDFIYQVYRIPTRRGVAVSPFACPEKQVGAPRTRAAKIQRVPVGKSWPSIVPEPIKMANLATNIQALRAARKKTPRLQVSEPSPPVKALKTTRGADHIVPFPLGSSAPLRESQSEPSLGSRVGCPLPPRRICPNKRLALTQEDIEPTSSKRRRLVYTDKLPVQASSTPPPGSLPGLIIPSPFADNSQSAAFRNSNSIMSLSELTATSTCELSSSGKPGALTRVLSLVFSSATTEDVEMAGADQGETPEMTMSSPGLAGLDSWVSSAPQTPVLDEEMKLTFDDDAVMTEVCHAEDEVMWEVRRDEDEVMRDWTDEDVVMAGVT